MLLAPGPFVPLQLASAPPSPEPPTLLDSMKSEALIIDGALDGIFADTLVAGANLPSGSTTEADDAINLAAWGLDYESSDYFQSGLDQANYAQAEIETYSDASLAATPDEAYQPRPNANPEYTYGQTWQVDSDNPVTPPYDDTPEQVNYVPTVAVTLVNLDNPGAKGGKVGDSFRLTIVSQNPGRVHVKSSRNGIQYPDTPFQFIAAKEPFVLEGIWDQTSQGIWTETWYVDDVPAYPVLSFTVS